MFEDEDRKGEDFGGVAPIDYLRLIWTPAIGYVFWAEVPGVLNWIGIAAIVISGICIVTQGRLVPVAGR